ncbi:Beta-galactosidase precursor [Pelomyxa schiedti]|nr:Beta-galactosidase precursor [Pelomyxa schiedti]
MSLVDRYYSVLLPKLKPFVYSSGGPIIAMQIENEYGSFGNDHSYLEHMISTYESNGLDCVYFASNGPTDQALQAGAVDSILRTINFGTGTSPSNSFETLRLYQPTGPLFVTEWWDGWFDHWGEIHHTVTPALAAERLDEILAYQNASVSIYMYTGGTNFNFWNGANYDGYYQPTITSYDYDAPIGENGDVSDKFTALRDVIGKYLTVPSEVPVSSPKKGYGNVTMQPISRLLDPIVLAKLCPQPTTSSRTMTMEELGQNFGFVLYRTSVQGPLTDATLNIQDCHDRALIFLDDEYQGVVDRGSLVEPAVSISIESEGTLHILVENEGRINFGPYLEDFKGITSGVRLPDMFLFGWTMYPLPLEDIDVLPTTSFTPITNDPAFYRGYFEISDTPMDTFVSFEGWGKGVCFVNGVNIGRYWPSKGPQQTLYLPAPFLHQGQNEIVLLELYTFANELHLVDTQDLGRGN